MTPDKTQKKPKHILLKVGKVVLGIFLFLLLLVVLVVLLIQTPPGQRFAKNKAEKYLQNKLKTRFEIGKISIGFPKDVVLDNIYVEDRQKDTLLYGGSLRVDLDMWKLLKSEIEVDQIKLESITAKIKRQLPDTTFNFQFIIDAFASEQKKPATTDTTPLKLDVRYVQLDKIRLVYKDVITGNDMDVWLEHFDTKIDRFDPTHMAFDIPKTTLRGVTARVYQSKPLLVAEPTAKDMNEAKAPIDMQLNFKAINLNDINLDYRNDVSATYSNLHLGEMVIGANNLDLKNRVIDLQDLNLNNTIASIRLGKKQAAVVVAKEVNKEIKSQVQNDWRVVVNSIRFDHNDIRFDDDNKPHLRKGMDFSHLNAKDLTLHIDDLLYSTDSIKGVIAKANFSEQSGFKLNNWQTNFLYSNKQAYMQDMLLETPGTLIRRSITLNYPSIEALQKNIAALDMDIDLKNSKVQVKDILTFVPALASQPAFKNPNSTWRINGRILGTVSRLQLKTLQLQALQDTRLNISGIIYGLPDAKNVRGDLNIAELSSSRRDITSIAPKGSLPANITIPERLKLSGKLRGGMTAISTDLVLNTTSGSATIKGMIKQPADAKRSQYDLALQTRNLNLGTILQNPQMLGPITARFKAKGRGYDPKYADASISGVIQSAVIKQYNYKDFNLTASVSHQELEAKAYMHDPNLDFSLSASGNLGAKFPSIRVVADIDSIKTLPLHFTTSTVVYRGKITADFPVTDPDHLSGQLLVTHSLLVTPDQRLQFDTIKLAAGSNDSGQYIHFASDILSLNLQGQYRLTQLGAVFQQAIQPYFAIIPNYKVTPVDPYDFTFTGNLINKPLLKTFLPALERMEKVDINGRFSSTNGWAATITAPSVIYGTNTIQNLKLEAGTAQNALNVKTTLQKFQSGTSIIVFGTTVNASVANNMIDFTVNVRDQKARDKYNLAGLFQQPQNGTYIFSIKPGNLLLNYDTWTITGTNRITVSPQGVNARDFVLSHDVQQLRINSLTESPTAPLEVSFESFRIATLANFIQSDSLLVDGNFNGKVVLENLMTQPTFTSDLVVHDLSVKKDTIGDVKLQVNNTVLNTYAANVTLTGKGNDVQLVGNYYVKPNNASSFDLNLDIRQILLNTIEGATMGAINHASGAITGKFAINGTVQKPNVNGNLDFNRAAFSITMLNNYYAILDENIEVNNEGIRFSTFTIKDSTDNKAILDGMAYTTNFTNYRFDLRFTADNFHALNTTKKQNQLYYGQLYFTSDIKITGTEKKPVVDGNLSINDKTKMTIVLPQQQPGVVDREGIVLFVDMDNQADDSLLFARYDSLNNSEITGLDVSANINVSKNAEFNLVIDEANGDFVKVRGEAILNGGVDPSGKITMTGSYEIEEGSYELSFNFLKRKFDIQKGSKIIWTGEPTAANVDVTAIYTANTAPLDLVQNQVSESANAVKNTYLQKLPFQVFLKISGELLKPLLAFDITLPDKNYNVSNEIINTVNAKLDQIRQEPSELNKQVFALLLLGRFVSENPFQSSGSGMTAAGFARQSVSKLLTEQLNRLAGDLIQGVDINFGVQSTDDYTTGQRRDRTDFNVALSKRLLNDRLKVTVGSNFEIEGPTAGNQKSNNLGGDVNIDYQLSQDGRYALRAYRKNEYDATVEGYIVETGVGFVITVDYNKLNQIFMSKKQRTERRKIRQENKEQQKKTEENTTIASPADNRRQDTTIPNANSNE